MEVADDAATKETYARIRAHVAEGHLERGVGLAVQVLGPEVHGFLCASMANEADADEVFSAVCLRLWRSLANFEWRCTLRTWTYVIARREMERFLRGTRRHVAGRVRLSELAEVIAAARTASQSSRRSEKRSRMEQLRDELPPEDRALLVLRVDRGLPWEEIALAFVENPEAPSEEERRREASRLRKRFQLVKERLARRIKEEGLLSK